MTELERVFEYLRTGRTISHEEPIGWFCRWRVDKYTGVDLNQPNLHERWERGLILPDDYVEGEKNLLTTIGATDMLNGLVTAGLGTPWNSTNAGLVVGDSSSAATNAQTDTQAAAGSAIQTSGFTSVTNATPQVITNGSGSWTSTPTVGGTVTVSGITTDTQINNTWEVQASTSTTVTALNSTAGGVAGSLASGVMKIINRYAQIVNGAPVVSTNTVQFVSVYGANNGNFAWQEFTTQLGLAGTNKQAQPLTKMLNRAVASNGTKAQGSTWTLTETITLS